MNYIVYDFENYLFKYILPIRLSAVFTIYPVWDYLKNGNK